MRCREIVLIAIVGLLAPAAARTTTALAQEAAAEVPGTLSQPQRGGSVFQLRDSVLQERGSILAERGSALQEPGLIPGGSRPRSRPTGLLQLLSATEPVPNPLLETIPPGTPAQAADGSSQPGLPPAGGPLAWSSPYCMTPQPEEPRAGLTGWLPLGILPWGPRSPLAQRAVGYGSPLTGTSWLNRPWSAGWFAGPIVGSPLTAGVHQQAGFFGGYRLGWDYDYYWGLEARVGAASIGLSEPQRIGRPGTNDYWVLDGSLLWYPWGDSAWRPYASFGMGLANAAFYDLHNHRVNQTMFATPIGIGLKYRWTHWIVLRGDIVDNIAYGSGEVDTQNNVSFTLAAEVRFGGVRRSYWPWYPSHIIH